MSVDKIKIEVNGVELEARPGQMLIEVTDAADIYVPRFCYHRKLSVAANCRMCLVEVEKAPKPLPACATPVADGMKVSTRSHKAISAQKSVMEFLLINHPLDCPICDQGGECELQDIAMGFGRGISRYAERKRSVTDEDLGPLVSTDMTRCIHCTRCVRFGQEIAGIQELGAIGRGENMSISTYIAHTVDHELSGNIIDLCPVGALNNKPYRYSARAWEMAQHPSVAPHDCLGSNIYLHVKNGRVQRAVPRANDAINETWASDRDRFSCEGIYAEDRLDAPMVRDDGELRSCSWDEALQRVAERLAAVRGDIGTLVSPSATSEEGYLAARISRYLGSNSIDHRLRRRDFRQQEADPVYPGIGRPLAEIEAADAVLLVGSNLRKEVPILAHRVRKAALRGARVSVVNMAAHDYLFPLAASFVHADLVAELGRIVWAAGKGRALSPAIEALDLDIRAPDAVDARQAEALRDAPNAVILLGQVSMRHPRFAEIRLLAAELAGLTGASLGYLAEGANAAGLSLAGVLPHRDVGGLPLKTAGANAAQILANPPRGLVLLGVEPELDCAEGERALAAVSASEFVVALSPYLTDSLALHADVVLPMGVFAETPGSFVNAMGDWQQFERAADPVGASRPGWEILTVLAGLLGMPDCAYESFEDVSSELRARVGDLRLDAGLPSDRPLKRVATAPIDYAELDVPMYQVDALVRRSACLQETRDGQAGRDVSAVQRKMA